MTTEDCKDFQDKLLGLLEKIIEWERYNAILSVETITRLDTEYQRPKAPDEQ